MIDWPTLALMSVELPVILSSARSLAPPAACSLPPRRRLVTAWLAVAPAAPVRLLLRRLHRVLLLRDGDSAECERGSGASKGQFRKASS